MLKSLLLIALRNMRKDKAYTAINVLGLTVGIACSMFLLLYILDELSYDRYHKDAPNIYRVVTHIKETDDAFTWAVAQIPFAEEVRNNYPEVKNAVRFFGTGRTLYRYEEKEFYEDKFFQADSTAFDMFTYTFLAGDPNTALDEPFSIVLTRSIAIKYFGKTDVLGQSFQNQQGETFKVTAVMEDVPLNSHFIFDALISAASRGKNDGGSWGNFGIYTYIQLPEGYDLSKMYANLDKIVKEKVDPIFVQYGITIRYELQRIIDIHLYSEIQDEAEAGGSMSVLYIFGAVAVFMLVIASINYMNLATARSANRAKEVGIRKVMGSPRTQLMAQFIMESVVITFTSLILSLLLIYALLPAFNELATKRMPFSYVLQAPVLLSLLGIVLVVGVGGGSYPAFYLSSFNPVGVLKGKLSAKGGSVIFRKVLVVLQFAISIFMLISTMIVFDQLQYMRTKDLGFSKDRVVRIALSDDAQIMKAEVLAERLRQTKGVEWAGASNAGPGDGIGKLLLKVDDSEGKLVERGINLYRADFDFIKTIGMTVVQGRDFSRDVASDTTFAVLVNEAMVKRMGWKDPIGKRFVFMNDKPVEKHVVGVVKDYHQNSLYGVIEPLMIMLGEDDNYLLFVRVEEGEDTREALAAIESTWNGVFSNIPFEYDFLDQRFDSQYKSDEKRSYIFTLFSFLTIAIACLGLLGLASFTTQQRYKEIGIRKVIGASVQGLIMLVAREFFILVGIGTIIAFPFAWYITNTWLQKFAYRIELAGEWATFILSALLALLITMLTVGYHVLRAASANPVNALRDE
jgi:putative ABC transport system permease protein